MLLKFNKNYLQILIKNVQNQVWLAVSGGEELKNVVPGLYQQLLDGPHSPEVAEIIRTDLPRTFPDNIFFNNTKSHQLQLYNILLAFAHQNRDVGYCQVSFFPEIKYPSLKKSGFIVDYIPGIELHSRIIASGNKKRGNSFLVAESIN